MSKEARNKRPVVSPAVAEKIRELGKLIAQERFGPEGVPIDITFSEIEEIGHQAGQMVAAQVDRELVGDHQEHFADEQACPQCGQPCASRPCERDLTTRDGRMGLPEAVCYCPTCRRSFFPSADSLEA
jgi:hypothetical protein